MSIELDNRWGYLYNLSGTDDLKIKFDLLERYTIDIWLKFNHLKYMKNICINGKPVHRSNRCSSCISEEHQYVSDVFKIDQWHHLVITNYQPGDLNPSLTLYLNGRLNKKINQPFSVGKSLNLKCKSINRKIDLRTGSQTGLSTDDFLIACIKIYNRILNQQEILENYKNLAKKYQGITITGQKITNGLIFEGPYIGIQEGSQVGSESNSNIKIKSNNSYMNKTNEVKYIIMNNPIEKKKSKRRNTDGIDLDDLVIRYDRKDKPDIGIGARKTKILLDYLRSDPQLFIQVLQSDILTTQQLSELSTLLTKKIRMDRGMYGGNKTDKSNDQNSTYPTNVVNVVERLYRLIHTKNDNYQSVYTRLKSLNAKIAEEEISRQIKTYPPSTERLNGRINGLIVRSSKLVSEQNGSNKPNISNGQNVNDQLFTVILNNQKEILGLLLKDRKCVGHINRDNGKIIEYERIKSNRPVKILMNPDLYMNDIINIYRRNKLNRMNRLRIGRKYVTSDLFGGSNPDDQDDYSNDDILINSIGQGINTNGNTISYIVQDPSSKEKYYYPIKETKVINQIPVIAIITANPSVNPISTAKPLSTVNPVITSESSRPVSKEMQVLSSVNHGTSEENFCVRNPIYDQNWVN